MEKYKIEAYKKASRYLVCILLGVAMGKVLGRTRDVVKGPKNNITSIVQEADPNCLTVTLKGAGNKVRYMRFMKENPLHTLFYNPEMSKKDQTPYKKMWDRIEEPN